MGPAAQKRNLFDHMNGIHVQQVFDELTDRFGFPEKEWKKKWHEYLGKKPHHEDEIGWFLRFGYDHINPILNALLLRGTAASTFTNLCEYVIRRSMGRRIG